MIIKVELYESKYCNGCPCLHTVQQENDTRLHCGLYKEFLHEDSRHRVIRIYKCIKDNGK